MASQAPQSYHRTPVPPSGRLCELQPYAFTRVEPGRSKGQASTRHRRSPIAALTVDLLQTFSVCNPSYKYSSKLNPRRALTKPAQPVGNTYDNANADYILYVSDTIDGVSCKYVVLDLLGQGTFGQVVKCRKLNTDEIYAIKIVKSKRAYYNQGVIEVKILEQLNKVYDPDDKNHIVRLTESFLFRKHLCLVFELLSINLYELIKQNLYRGLSTVLLRVFMAQILEGLVVLSNAKVLHCDLKPENILLTSLTTPHIKLIDFGSACFEGNTVYTYIQSRFYRSPEIILGYSASPGFSYTPAIDIWSLGCIAAELFLGLPLFPGHSEYNQLVRIIEMRGPIPDHMIEKGKFSNKFFEKDATGYRMKTEEQYARETKTTVQPFKRYFNYTKLDELIMNYPYKKDMTHEQIEMEKANRRAFTHFVSGLLQLDPADRWTAEQAIKHPFITGEPFNGTFNPPPSTPSRPSVPPSPARSTPNTYYQRPHQANYGVVEGYGSPHLTAGYLGANLGVSPSVTAPGSHYSPNMYTSQFPSKPHLSSLVPPLPLRELSPKSYHQNRSRSNSSPPKYPNNSNSKGVHNNYSPYSNMSPRNLNPNYEASPGSSLSLSSGGFYRNPNGSRVTGRQRSNSNPHSPGLKDKFNSNSNKNPGDATYRRLRARQRRVESLGDQSESNYTPGAISKTSLATNSIRPRSDSTSEQSSGDISPDTNEPFWDDTFLLDEQLDSPAMTSPNSPQRATWGSQTHQQQNAPTERMLSSFNQINLGETPQNNSWRKDSNFMLPTLGSSVSSNSYVPSQQQMYNSYQAGTSYTGPSYQNFGTSPYILNANSLFGSSPSVANTYGSYNNQSYFSAPNNYEEPEERKGIPIKKK